MSAITLARPAVPSVAGRTTRALGTFCSVLVAAPGALGAAQQMLSGQIAAIDLACSRFRPDSELSALNRSSGTRCTVSPLFAGALAAALRAAEITDGDVDPTCGGSLQSLGYDKDFAELAADTSALIRPPVPAPGWQCVEFDAALLSVRVPSSVVLDLGATAKAFAADVAANAIFEQIGCGVLVNLGGDIAVAGPAPDGGWRIGVEDGRRHWRIGRRPRVQRLRGAPVCCRRRRWHRHLVSRGPHLAPGGSGSASHCGACDRATSRDLLDQRFGRGCDLRRREHGEHGVDHPRS